MYLCLYAIIFNWLHTYLYMYLWVKKISIFVFHIMACVRSFGYFTSHHFIWFLTEWRFDAVRRLTPLITLFFFYQTLNELECFTLNSPCKHALEPWHLHAYEAQLCVLCLMHKGWTRSRWGGLSLKEINHPTFTPLPETRVSLFYSSHPPQCNEEEKQSLSIWMTSMTSENASSRKEQGKNSRKKKRK